MNHKVIPIVGDGYTLRTFRLDFSEQDWSEKPHLRTSVSTSAQFALSAGDHGLSGIGINKGDLLLFSTTIPLRQQEQVSLIRIEDEYRIGVTYWTPDTTVLRASGSVDAVEEAEQVELPTENIRIVAALDNAIKRSDNFDIVHFRQILI